MQPDMFWAGLACGIVVGLTGMGAGSLLAPALVAVFGINPVTAVGTSLLVKASMKSLELLSYIVRRQVNYKVGGILVAGAVPCALVAAMALGVLHRSQIPADFGIHWTLAVVVLLAGLASLARPLYSYRFHDGDVRVLASLKVRLTACIIVGIVGGSFMGLTAIGSAALVIPVLGLLYLMRGERVAGTDAFQTFIVAASAALAYGVAGNISWPLAGNVLLGAIPGVSVGLWLADKELGLETVVRSSAGALASAMGIWMLVSLYRGAGTPTP